MKKIVAMGLLAILFLGKMNADTIYADVLNEPKQEEVSGWTEEEIRADFAKKYFEGENYIKESIPNNVLDLMKEHLYITEEERREVAERIENLEIIEGVLYSLEVGNVSIFFSINEQNKLLKTLLYTDDVEYSLANMENEQVTVFSPMGVKNVRYLLQHELDEFKEDVRNHVIPEAATYSLEYMRTYLEGKHAGERNKLLCEYKSNK